VEHGGFTHFGVFVQNSDPEVIRAHQVALESELSLYGVVDPKKLFDSICLEAGVTHAR
jgi:hypothetical protein